MNCIECQYEPDWVSRKDGQYGTCKLMKSAESDRFILTYDYDNSPLIRENNHGNRYVNDCFLGIKKW